MAQVSDFQLAQRPGFCTRGAILEVFVNAFEVRAFPKVNFIHYDVINPLPSGSKLASKIIQRLQHHTAPTIFSHVVSVFDGVKNLFALGRPLFQGVDMTFNVNMSDNPPVGPNPRGLYNVKLNRVADVSPSDLMHVLGGHGAGMPTTTTPLQVLNLLVQQAAAVTFPLHTKQRYFTRQGHSAFGGFEIWRGFFASVRPTPGRLLVNVDMATGVMYQRGRLIDFILAYFGLQNAQTLNDMNERHPQWTRMKALLKGVQVSTTPMGRLRTIRTAVENAGDFVFEVENEQSITVGQYFRERYNITLRFPHIPGICTSKGEVYPFELCEIKEGQLFKRKTSPELMSQVLNFAKKKPEDRLNIVRTGMANMQLGNSPFIVQAGMTISPQPMQVQGRILGPPPMVYGEGIKERPRSGSWNMLDKKLIEPMVIKTWSIVCFERVNIEEIRRFVLGLKAAMEVVGMNAMSAPEPIETVAPYHVAKDLRRVCDVVGKRTKNPPTLLLVILPRSAAAIRKEVKQFGDVIEGIVTQCVNERVDKLRSANNQYYNNLILKINAKLGGANTRPSGESPSFKWFLDGKTMVVGADVTHPGPGVLRPSVASLVASIDEGAAKYISRCAVQGPRTEIIQDLEDLMTYALGMFYKYRKYLSGKLRQDIPLLPERIVMYRDGVSEGEIREVVENEIKQVENAVKKVYGEKGAPFRAALTFIVVGKRHHFRFIPKNARDGDKSGNAPAGLLVDREITTPGIYDFYLLSHAGLLGTSRPSHYIVVKDDNNFDADTLQGFSFDLCHTYARATRSVSIPAPCYYADIACSRADFHFNPSLNYDDDLSSTGGEFDLNPWIEGFSNVHPRQATNMYFM